MSLEEKAIEMIEKSINEEYPLAQRDMPYYYDNKIDYIKSAIVHLEKAIKQFKKQKKDWDPYSLNSNISNNNNNEENNGSNMNLSNGGRRRRITHKKRK